MRVLTIQIILFLYLILLFSLLPRIWRMVTMKLKNTRFWGFPIYILSLELSFMLIILFSIVTFQEPQSAPPAIKEYGNGDPKLRKSCVDRQLVGH